MKLSFGYYAFALAVLIIGAVWFKERAAEVNARDDEYHELTQPR